MWFSFSNLQTNWSLLPHLMLQFQVIFRNHKHKFSEFIRGALFLNRKVIQIGDRHYSTKEYYTELLITLYCCLELSIIVVGSFQLGKKRHI